MKPTIILSRLILHEWRINAGLQQTDLPITIMLVSRTDMQHQPRNILFVQQKRNAISAISLRRGKPSNFIFSLRITVL